MKKIDDLLIQYTENDDLPSAIAGVANAQGVLYVGAAGKRSLNETQSMSADAIIDIASMTKAVTTVATLQLVETGAIDLDEPINTYLPQLKELKVLEGFDSNNKPRLITPNTIPTTRQLLTHTSGYVYEIWNADALRYVTSGHVGSLFAPQSDGLMAPLAFSPGERWEYGIGIDWAGILIETISGKELDTYFAENIFDPLKMHDTFFSVPENKVSRRSSMYSRSPEGLITVPHSPDGGSGGGGLNSTIGDYLSFLRMLLNDGTLDNERILKPATVRSMFENHIGELQVAAGKTQRPALSNDFDLTFNTPAKWGLGFLLHEKQTPAGRAAGSASWAGLFNTYFWIDRETDLCAVIGSQLLPFFDESAIAMLKDFEKTVYDYYAN